MTHKCEYCDKEIQPCSNPCVYRVTNKSHICCTCPDAACELPEKVICDGPICTLKFQVSWLEMRQQELTEQTDANLAKLKEITNSFRILGFGPKALETLIQTQGLNIPGLFISQNDKFTWDTASPDDCVSIGLQFMRGYETLTKNWAGFLNEKAVKVQIKKDQVLKTNKRIADAQKNSVKESPPELKKNKKALTPKEKLVVHHMRTLKMTQAQAEAYVTNVLMLPGECGDLTQYI